MALSPQQERFCLEVARGSPATEAYRIAYPRSRNWSSESLRNRAATVIKNDYIIMRIDEIRSRIIDETVEKTAVTEARAVEEAARIGLLDPARMFGEDGKLLAIQQMPPDVRAAIASFEIVDKGDKGRVRKIKLWDKNSALEKLMKHLGSFEKDNKQRNGVFDDVPSDTVRLIQEKLREISRRNGNSVAGDAAGTRSNDFTH